jgi:hypothetical protein
MCREWLSLKLDETSILAVARAHCQRIHGVAVTSVLQSPVHRSEVWRRLFGFPPKISTTVENIVENTGLYLSSKKTCCFSGFFGAFGDETAEFWRLLRAFDS